jgi:hypothetical protein
MSIWTIILMNIPFDSIVELPLPVGNCSTGSSSRLSPQSQESMMDLSRAYGQLVREITIYSGYASQGDTPIRKYKEKIQCLVEKKIVIEIIDSLTSNNLPKWVEFYEP